MGSSRDVELTVRSIDNEWSIARDGVTKLPGLDLTRTIIEIDPAEIVLIHSHHHKPLNMVRVVMR